MEDEEDVDFAVKPDEDEEETGLGGMGPADGFLKTLGSELTRSREQAIRSRKALWDGYAEALRSRRSGQLDKTDRIINALQTFGTPRRGGVWHDLAAMNQTVIADDRSNRKAAREREDAIREAELRGEMDLAGLAEKYDLKGIDLYGSLAGKSMTAMAAMRPKQTVTMSDMGPVVTTTYPDGRPPTSRPATPEEVAAGGASAAPTAGAEAPGAAPAANGPGGPPGSTFVGPDGATYMNQFGKPPAKISDIPPAEKAKIEAEAKILAEAAANAKVKMPDALLSARAAFKAIDELNAHPGLSAMVGMPNPLGGNLGPLGLIPGSPAAGAKARLDQLMSGAFLQAREALKGAGQVTDFEGEKAEKAMARMSAATSEAEFRQALADYRQAITDGMRKLQALANGTYRMEGSATTPGGTVDLGKFWKGK